MRHFTIAAFSILFLAFQSCQSSLTDYATNWSNGVKSKILEDANQQPDKIVFDSSSFTVTLYKGDSKLKFFYLEPNIGENGKMLSMDTAASIFYSKDQKFELVRELCPIIERSFEGIRYQGEHIGLAEFKFCDGRIKIRGFRFNGDVGVWKEYDTVGRLIGESDHGNIDRLEKLKEIKYYR